MNLIISLFFIFFNYNFLWYFYSTIIVNISPQKNIWSWQKNLVGFPHLLTGRVPVVTFGSTHPVGHSMVLKAEIFLYLLLELSKTETVSLQTNKYKSSFEYFLG